MVLAKRPGASTSAARNSAAQPGHVELGHLRPRFQHRPDVISVPFFLVVRQGPAHGIFLDSTWRSFFDVGHEDDELLTLGAAGGELD